MVVNDVPLCDVFIQEHLTKATKALLKSTKDALTGKGFAYPGYVKDGEVRVRTFEFGPYEVITCDDDYKKLLAKNNMESNEGQDEGEK